MRLRNKWPINTHKSDAYADVYPACTRAQMCTTAHCCLFFRVENKKEPLCSPIKGRERTYHHVMDRAHDRLLKTRHYTENLVTEPDVCPTSIKQINTQTVFCRHMFHVPLEGKTWSRIMIPQASAISVHTPFPNHLYLLDCSSDRFPSNASLPWEP